jgi:hypothetical protein
MQDPSNVLIILAVRTIDLKVVICDMEAAQKFAAWVAQETDT